MTVAKLFIRAWRLQNLYKIRKEDRTLGKMTFTPVQVGMFKKAEERRFKGIRLLAPKGRKMRVSTFWLLFYLDDTIFHGNVCTVIIAHRQQDVQKLFKIVRLAYRTCPSKIILPNGKVWTKPNANYDNVNELRFDDINSSISVALEVRGDTPNNLHISEGHYIEDDKIRATLASVPNRVYGSNVTIESTGNGVGGLFYEYCEEASIGGSEYDMTFIPWFNDAKNATVCVEPLVLDESEQILKDKVFEVYSVKLSDEQMLWYRLKRKEQGRLMPQEFPTFFEDCWLATGSMALDSSEVNKIITVPPLETRRVYYREKEYQKVLEVKIWARPIPGRRYVVGCDPAEGVGGDRTAIEVLDAVTLTQVAELVSDTIKPSETAVVVDNLARYYNMALAVVERNGNHGATVLENLKKLYSNIFCKVVTDEKTNKKTKKLGWETNSHTRDLVLDELEMLVLQSSIVIKSAILKGEMLTFIVTDDGRREAKKGKHDDTIMALAISVKVARMPRASFAVYSLN